MEIKGLIFDMDGTLVDSMGPSRAYKRALCEKCGLPIDQELSALVDYHSNWEALRTYIHARCGLFEQSADFWADFYQTMRAFYDEHAAPLPGAEPFLREMKRRGYKLGVATATPRVNARAALEYAGILQYIDVVVSTKDIGIEKSRPDVYLECARQMGGLKKDDVIVFEDDFHCARTLHAHQFTTIGFRDRHTPAEQLEVLSQLCLRTIDDYRELLEPESSFPEISSAGSM